MPFRRARVSILCAFGLLTPAAMAHAQTTGSNQTHDPSRVIESEGRFYFFGTGGGGASSADGFTWTGSPSPIQGGPPAEATAAVGANNGGIWAPDVMYLNGQYYYYYAIANTDNSLTSKTKACAIGLFTSPTLNPKSPNYKWTDHGIVVSSGNPTTHASSDYCTIDPAPGLDAEGNLWLSWGSGYGKGSVPTVYITRLDNTTGLVSSADTVKPGHALGPMGAVEASYFYYKSGYYYLFWNSGGCCSGSSSTYEIHVARSQSILGPYTENSQMFYKTNGSIHGPGQIGIYDKCGFSRFTYHYYPDTGTSVLGMNELTFANGWPVAGAVSTTPLKPCGDYGSDAGAGSAPVPTSDAGSSDDAMVVDSGSMGGQSGAGSQSDTGTETSPGTQSGASGTDMGGSGGSGTVSASGSSDSSGSVSQNSGTASGDASGTRAGASSGTTPEVDAGGTVGVSGATAPGEPSTSGGCSVASRAALDERSGMGGLALVFVLVRRRFKTLASRRSA